LIQGHAGARLDLHAVFKPKGLNLRAAAPHCAAHLCACIFQREIQMSRSRASEIGHLAAYRHRRNAAFERLSCELIKLFNTEGTVSCKKRECFRHVEDSNSRPTNVLDRSKSLWEQRIMIKLLFFNKKIVLRKIAAISARA